MTANRSTNSATVAPAMPGGDVAPELAHLAAAFDASRSMLDLPDGWDGDGSPGYDEATWQRAAAFLFRNAVEIRDEFGAVLPPPKVRKGPGGSIDLHWRTATRELLFNIPAEPGAPADFYGDDGAGGQETRGTLDPEREGRDLMLWLTA